jgi:hypothetical protein
MNAQNDYWKECLASSFDEHGVTVTKEQLAAIAGDVAMGNECYGMAFHTPENPLSCELRDAKAALKKEIEKVICRTCNGRGRITTQGPCHSSNSQCWKCCGEGKHAP